MLEKVDLLKKLSKEEYKEKMSQLETKIGQLQRECKALKIPIMIVFEGFGAAGKGLQIGKLIQSMDPRGFHVYPVKNETEEERMHPFLWRFWIKTPEKGRIAIYDGSWYRRVLIDRFEKRTKEKINNTGDIADFDIGGYCIFHCGPLPWQPAVFGAADLAGDLYPGRTGPCLACYGICSFAAYVGGLVFRRGAGCSRRAASSGAE